MEIRTAHIVAAEGDFAKTVIMPGDPLRAKFIAETYLEDVKEISGIRGITAYTGTFENKLITIMPSGMGMPSMGIYCYELYTQCGVERIIRVGTAGAINKNLNLKDTVVGMGVSVDSNFINQFELDGNLSLIASYSLLEKTVNTAKKLDIDLNIGNILSTDIFYRENKNFYKKWAEIGVLAVEMEAGALYSTAMSLNKEAIAICTISDKILEEGVSCTAEEREQSFTKTIELVLNVGILD